MSRSMKGAGKQVNIILFMLKTSIILRRFNRPFYRPLNTYRFSCTRSTLRYSCSSTLAKAAVFPSALQPSSGAGIYKFVESKVWNATHRDTRIRPRPGQSGSSGPRPQQPRRPPWLDSVPQDLIFYGIMVVNGVVFLMWQIAASQSVSLMHLSATLDPQNAT